MSDETKITPTMTVREVISKYPSAVNVFNKYGLTGCGGRLGPQEPIGFFAIVHQVDPAQLLQELNAIANEQEKIEVHQATEKGEQDIYRPFIKAAMIIALTVGCTLGAINLAAMGFSGSVATTWMALTQAHGHAQIFGWVGLFIMGIAYHVLPRLKATQLKAKPLAYASFWLILVGIILRFVAQPLGAVTPFEIITVLSAALQVLGASFFAYVSLATFRSGAGSRDFYDKYMIASIVWFWMLAASTLAISLVVASQRAATIPSAVDAAYLHVALMGFVSMMIFGFSLRTIPLFMGLRAPNKRAFDIVFWLLNLAVAGRALGMLASNTSSHSLVPFLVQASAGLEYASIVAFVYFLNIFRKPEINIAEAGVDQGYEKYIKAAYTWLLIAATMAFSYTLYEAITGFEVDHAYIGAYRHALTVGFISMMILGMASRIIPVFTGVRLYSSSLLLATFILVNIGNAMRVISQPLAHELGGIFFATMGLSGFVEVVGLALFTYNIWRTMDNKAEEDKAEEKRFSPRADEVDSTPTASPWSASIATSVSSPVTKDDIVGNIIERYPMTLEVFLRNGFSHLQNETLRKTVARTVTLETVCQIHSIDLERLLAELNEACTAEARERG